MDNESLEIVRKLEQLRQMIEQNTGNQQMYQLQLEQYSLKQSEFARKVQEASTKLRTPQSDAMLLQYKRSIDGMFERVNAQQLELFTNIQRVIEMLGEMQSITIKNRLAIWQREQALAGGNGASFQHNALDEIQMWFQQLADLIVRTKSMIDTMRRTIPMNNANNSSELCDLAYREITSIFQNVIRSAFVVDKQPPQVIKTKTQRFGASVRLMLTNIGLHLSNPYVSVSIISEEQARALQQNLIDTATFGEILNNTAHLEIKDGHFHFDLRNMQLKNIKRAEKKGAENVTDEKFALLFKTTLYAGDMQLNISTMSLPIVIIVHTNQEPQSWATILWDNTFSDVNRIPFTVVDQVPWQQLASALGIRFHSQTGKCLTADNIHYLFEKICNTSSGFNAADTERLINWTQFSKENLPKCAFTFWEWFYAATKLIRDQLLEPWGEGLIIGFINGRQAKEMLLNSSPGTFLLRFSDSALGAITIFWVEIEEETGLPEIVKLQPFAQKDLAIRALGDCIKDLDQCVTLYPNIAKDIAFGKYYSHVDAQPTSNGYMPRTLKLVTKDSVESRSRAVSPRSVASPLSPFSPQSSISAQNDDTIPNCSIGDNNYDFGNSEYMEDLSEAELTALVDDLTSAQPEQILDGYFLKEFVDSINFDN